MKITEEVREYAAQHGLETQEAIDRGLAEKSAEFQAGGAQIY